MESAFAAAGIALLGVALGALIDYLRDLRHRRWAREDQRREQRRARVEELIVEVDRVKTNLVALGVELFRYATREAPFIEQPDRERFQAAKTGMIVAVYAPTISPQMESYRKAATGLGSAMTAAIEDSSEARITSLGNAVIQLEEACDALVAAAVSVIRESV